MANSAVLQTTVTDAVQAAPWQASLRLDFGLRGGHCRLLHNRHNGPLRLQRLLYPQGQGSAEALLLHPPGGIVGGDQLDIGIAVHSAARVLVTTPGAAKWYRSQGRSASQSVALSVTADAALEWLPQESILFDGSDAQQTLAIELEPGARMIGWDIVQLGRIAAGERWCSGRLRQRLRLCRNGRPIWLEQADLMADSPLRTAAQGLAGMPVFGTLWASAPELDDPAQLDALRAALALELAKLRRESGIRIDVAATWLAWPRGVLLVRVLADAAEPLRLLLEAAWAFLRPTVIGLDAVRPRIWST